MLSEVYTLKHPTVRTAYYSQIFIFYSKVHFSKVLFSHFYVLLLFLFQMKFVGLVYVVIGAFSVVNAANILGVFPINGRSHWVVYESLMKALVARGHNVTVITSFPQKKPVANYTDIDISESFPSAVNTISIDKIFQYLSSVSACQRFVTDLQLKLCRESQKLPQVKALLKSDIKFDAVSTC